MASTVTRLLGQGLITPPPWLPTNLHLEVMMGSHAYGCNTETSDYDIRGVFTGPKATYFPATAGLIVGYDPIPDTDPWSAQHVKTPSGSEYDFDLTDIAEFFKQARKNSANQIDMLFVHETCIRHITPVGRMMLEARHIFLSKLVWKQFRNYAAGQFKSLRDLKRKESKRIELIEKHGYDVKFASHCIRLVREAEQILTEGDLNLFAGSEELKAIRRGDWSYEKLKEIFDARVAGVEKVYHNSKLPEVPDENKVKDLLLNCLEHHYGSLSRVIVQPDATVKALRDIDVILSKVRNAI